METEDSTRMAPAYFVLLSADYDVHLRGHATGQAWLTSLPKTHDFRYTSAARKSVHPCALLHGRSFSMRATIFGYAGVILLAATIDSATSAEPEEIREP